MGVSKDFEKGMANSKDAKTRFKESKKARPSEGGMGWQPPKGNYICRVTADGVKDDKGMRVMFRNTIVSGELAGKSWTRTFFLDKGKDGKGTDEQVQRNWDFLSIASQTCLGIDGEEFESMGLSRVIDTIDEEGPYVKIGVDINKAKDKKNPKGPMKEFVNTYYNQLLDPDDVNDETEGDEEEEDEEEGEEEEDDLEALGTAADDGDEDAIATLTEKAEEAGLSVDDYGPWADLATALLAAGGDGEEQEEEEESEEEEEESEEEEEESEEEDEIVFEKDDFVYFKPKGKRTAVECQVTSSNKPKKTANLKEYEGGEKHSNVPWDKLEHVTEE